MHLLTFKNPYFYLCLTFCYGVLQISIDKQQLDFQSLLFDNNLRMILSKHWLTFGQSHQFKQVTVIWISVS
jgi:hypothetical protein